MLSNVRPVGSTYEMTDYTLFMYGLVRGDRVTVSTEGEPHYVELGLYELDGQWRLGIPYFERPSVWTRLSGLVTASRVEFSVLPADAERLKHHGHVTAVVRSALRGVE